MSGSVDDRDSYVIGKERSLETSQVAGLEGSGSTGKTSIGDMQNGAGSTICANIGANITADTLHDSLVWNADALATDYAGASTVRKRFTGRTRTRSIGFQRAAGAESPSLVWSAGEAF